MGKMVENRGIDVCVGRERPTGEALIEHLILLETLLNTIPSPIFYKDTEGVYRGCNESFSFLILGIPPEKIIGRSFFDLPDIIPRDLAEVYRKADMALIENPGVQVYETQVQCKDGVRRDYLFRKATYNDDKGRVAGIVGVMLDVTDKNLAERKLREEKDKVDEALRKLKDAQALVIQQEKLASIGQLAAGVAHEINNPTGFVSSNLNTLSEYLRDLFRLVEGYRAVVRGLRKTDPLTGPVSDLVRQVEAMESEMDIGFIMGDASNLLEESKEGTERIKKIVKDLKDFAHPGKQELAYADINKNLDSTLNIAWNEIKYKAKVRKAYGDLPQVQCYPQQLNQVFMNLLVNAAQAIEEEGEIAITTHALNGHVEVRIIDTGKGIREEHLPRIFDPFFTTKEVGKGTGLGLNVAYNIVKKHKGSIEVESTLGKGTTFIVRIPVEGLVQETPTPS